MKLWQDTAKGAYPGVATRKGAYEIPGWAVALAKRGAKLAVLLLLAGCSDIQDKDVQVLPPRPNGRLEVGDCIRSVKGRERWESPVISRIQEIGRESYRVHFFLWRSILGSTYGAGDWSIGFDRVTDRVVCP